MTKETKGQSARAAEAEDPGLKELSAAARATYATPKEAEAQVAELNRQSKAQRDMQQKADQNRHAEE